MREDKWYVPPLVFLKWGFVFHLRLERRQERFPLLAFASATYEPKLVYLFFTIQKTRFHSAFCNVPHLLPLSLTSWDFPQSGAGVYETERQPYSEVERRGAGGGITFFPNPPRLLLWTARTPPPVMRLEHLDARQHPKLCLRREQGSLYFACICWR